MQKFDFIQSISNLTKEDIKSSFQVLLHSRKTKFIALSLTTLLSTLILLHVIFSFINLNKYSPFIEKQVLEQSGKALSIQGPIYLKTFPKLTVELHDVILKEHQHSKYAIFKAEVLKCYPHLFSMLWGKISFKIETAQIHVKSFFIPYFSSKISYQDKILDLKSIKMKMLSKFSKSDQEMKIDHIKIDFKNDQPQYYLKHQSNDFPLGALLELLKTKTNLHGNTSINVELSGDGSTANQIKKSLKGHIEIEIAQGKLYGLDLLASLKEARSVLETITSTLSQSFVDLYNAILHRKEQPHGITPFHNVKVLLEFKQGIVETKNLKVRHDHYHIDGQGHINLMKNTIHYQIDTHFQEHGKITQTALSNNKVPLLTVSIVGPLDNPSIKPDIASYLKYVGQNEDGSKKHLLPSLPSVPSLKKIIKSISG